MENTNKNEEPKEATKPTDQELNFSRLREKYQREQQAKLQAEEEIMRMRKQLDEINNRMSLQSHEEEEEEDDDPYLDKRSFRKKMSQWEKEFEKKFEKKVEEKASSLLKKKDEQAYLEKNKDFYSVMTEENLEVFANSHPHLAQSLLSMPDTFERQKLVYETMKTLGTKEKEQSSVQDKINKNLSNKGHYWSPQGATPPYQQTADFSKAGQKDAYSKMKELQQRLKI